MNRTSYFLGGAVLIGVLVAPNALSGGFDLPDFPSEVDFVQLSSLQIDLDGFAITSADDEDFVEFLSPVDGSVDFEILFSSAQGDLDLEIYDSNLPLETFDAVAARPHRLGVSASFSDNESVVLDLVAGQRVWIRAFGFLGATADYDFRITTDTEPNEDLASATGLLGGSFPSYEPLAISPSGDEDWYRIRAPANGALTVEIFFVDSQGDLDMDIHTESGFRLFSGTSTSDNEQFTIDPVIAGEEFLIRVFGFIGATNDYTMRIRTNEDYSNSFSSGGPGDVTLIGSASVVGNALQLTDEINGQNATATLPTFNGPIEAFNASFTYLFTRGTFDNPADGMSFNMGGVPDTLYAESENGPGQGLTVSFGLFDFGLGNAIVVYLDGVEMARANDVINEFSESGQPNAVEVDFDGFFITVRWNGFTVFNNVQAVPNTVTPDTLNPRNRMGFAAGTGGLNSRQVIDDIVIDAQVPEPGSALLGATALATLALLRSRARGRAS